MLNQLPLLFRKQEKRCPISVKGNHQRRGGNKLPNKVKLPNNGKLLKKVKLPKNGKKAGLNPTPGPTVRSKHPR